MDQDRFSAQVTEVSTLMEERLGLRGHTLDWKVKKAGRLLPRSVRRQAEYLAHAATLAQNPKLFPMIDQGKANLAHAELVVWLKGVDPSERRRTRIINLLAVIAFNLLIMAGILIWWLWWRGMV